MKLSEILLEHVYNKLVHAIGSTQLLYHVNLVSDFVVATYVSS